MVTCIPLETTIYRQKGDGNAWYSLYLKFHPHLAAIHIPSHPRMKDKRSAGEPSGWDSCRERGFGGCVFVLVKPLGFQYHAIGCVGYSMTLVVPSSTIS